MDTLEQHHGKVYWPVYISKSSLPPVPKSPQEHVQRLDQLVSKAGRTLLKVKGIFPFDFFPDTLHFFLFFREALHVQVERQPCIKPLFARHQNINLCRKSLPEVDGIRITFDNLIIKDNGCLILFELHILPGYKKAVFCKFFP